MLSMPCPCDHTCFSLPCTLCMVEIIWLCSCGRPLSSTIPRTVHWSRALPWASAQRLCRGGVAATASPFFLATACFSRPARTGDARFSQRESHLSPLCAFGSADAASNSPQSASADVDFCRHSAISCLRAPPPAGRPSAGQPSAEPKNLRLRKEHLDRGSVSLSTLGNGVQERQASHERNRFCLRHIKEETNKKILTLPQITAG
jgi:hypothetical protein